MKERGAVTGSTVLQLNSVRAPLPLPADGWSTGEPHTAPLVLCVKEWSAMVWFFFIYKSSKDPENIVFQRFRN
jgi:hypothetical protein